jgi:hypothetical protein
MPNPAPQQSPTSAEPADGLGEVPWYLWANVLGLDAVAVSLVWLWCFSTSEQVPLLRSTYLVLGLVVWLVYSFDRLLDATRIKNLGMATPRHRFARRYFKPMSALCVFVLAFAIYLVLFDLQRVLIYHGLVISMMVVLYFVLRLSTASNLQSLLPKEIFCGFVFALGSTYPVHALPNNFVAGVVTAELAVFAILCALNCTAISVWESGEDEANDDRATIVQTWPGVRHGYVKFAFVFAGIAVWLSARGPGRGAVGGGAEQSILSGVSPILLSAALSAALIGALGLTGEALSKNLRRVLADVALLTPLLIVPLLG